MGEDRRRRLNLKEVLSLQTPSLAKATLLLLILCKFVKDFPTDNSPLLRDRMLASFQEEWYTGEMKTDSRGPKGKETLSTEPSFFIVRVLSTFLCAGS